MNTPGFGPELEKVTGWRFGLRFNDLVPPPSLAKIDATWYAIMRRRTFAPLKNCIRKVARGTQAEEEGEEWEEEDIAVLSDEEDEM
jgi:hypothetical protein